ncbi:transmembrane protein 116 [Solea solea]|uniref:transmembrane protein 116 n=1 Tax=Solea solea TaxID=90069 RepID=UPI00272C80C9|nr:transmembrane protein 116 [Solea solea]
MFTMELNGTLSGDMIDELTIVYLVSLSPSVIGSVSVLVVSLVRWKHLKQQQVHLLVQLTLADLLAALTLMFTSVMNRVRTDDSVTICQHSLPLSLTFYFVSFLLVVVYAWKSKDAIQGWRTRPAEDESEQSQHRRRMLHIAVNVSVWLIPTAIYIGYVLTPFMKEALVIPVANKRINIRNNSKYCNSCLLFLHIWRDSCSDTEFKHDIFIRTFLFLVVIPVMLSCSVIYYKVGKWYERHHSQGIFPVEGDGRSRRRFSREFSTARNMVLVILFCWAPALVLILLSTLMTWTHVEQRSLFGLYVIQAASVSLQGFLNSMVYAWRRPNFTEAVLGENTPLVAHNHMAFFDESLKSSLTEC